MKLVVDLFQNGFWNSDMIIIAHRGNVDGPNPERENSPDYINEALSMGYDVEIDLRTKDKRLYLGHDKAQYLVNLEWLYKNRERLWIHCKDRESLEFCSSTDMNLHYFWHDRDSYTLTSKAIGWVMVGQIPYNNSIIVLPESISYYDKYEGKYDRILESKGICTDKCNHYQKELNEIVELKEI